MRFTKEFPTLKEAVQATMVYSPDLTAAVAQVQTDMDTDWDTLEGMDWQAVFVPSFLSYCLDANGTHFWGIETDQNTIRITKRDKSFATFEFLSTDMIEVSVGELVVSGWTKHS